jgi:hypothetical protein
MLRCLYCKPHHEKSPQAKENYSRDNKPHFFITTLFLHNNLKVQVTEV